MNNRSFISDDRVDEPIQLVLDHWEQKEFDTFRVRKCGEFERLVKEERIKFVLPTNDTTYYHTKDYKPAPGMVGTVLRQERGGDGSDGEKNEKPNRKRKNESRKQFEQRK